MPLTGLSGGCIQPRCKVLVRSKKRLWPCLEPLIGFWLWSAPSSCRYRGVNPSSCRYRGSNRGRDSRWQPLLVSIPGAAPSSSRYRGVNPADKIPDRGVNPADKVPPRVVIVVSNPPRVVIVVPAPPRVVIVVSTQRIRSLIACYDSTRVAIVGSNPGTAASSSRYRWPKPFRISA